MIALGAVASAHGVRGRFKVKPFTVMPGCCRLWTGLPRRWSGFAADCEVVVKNW